MKETENIIKIIKEIYDKVEKSYKITINNVCEFDIDTIQYKNAYNDVVSRLSLKLKNGKCSTLFLNQLTLHHCNFGERYNDKIEFYCSRNIINTIELLENNNYPSNQFIRKDSFINGLWKAHHNGRSQLYAYSRNIKQYWFKNNGELKRDISDILKRYPNNLDAILIEMQYQALNEKHNSTKDKIHKKITAK